MNIIEYVETEWRTFEEYPFTEVDSLVLSQFSYLDLPDFDVLCIKDLFRSEWFEGMCGHTRVPDENKRLLFGLASSPRFRNVQLSNYVNEFSSVDQTQFGAVTLQLDANTLYVAFRGTDATFVGWKEDFNLSYSNEVPSQKYALLYVEGLPKNQNLLIGGHSKGGNLAVYASAMADVSIQSRIVGIYSHDGPGFRRVVFSRPGFQNIASRVHKTVPEDSLIGMLMENYEKMRVVKTTKRALGAHDPFSWEIENGLFVEADSLSSSSQLMDQSITSWLRGLTDQERQTIIDRLYEVINQKDIVSFAEFKENLRENVSDIWKGLSNLDPEEKETVSEVFGALVKLIWENYWKH